MKYCYICYSLSEDYMICDTCDNNYCDGCSYTYNLFYQHQGARCYICSEQTRLTKINKSQIRNNKLKLILKK